MSLDAADVISMELVTQEAKMKKCANASSGMLANIVK
jgi:hypothetical protein